MSSNESIVLQRLQSLGLSAQKAAETIKNDTVTKLLLQMLDQITPDHSLTAGVGLLLYHLATKCRVSTRPHIPLLVEYILDGRLNSTLRLDHALAYLQKIENLQQLNTSEFEAECGIGVTVTPEQIEQAVEAEIDTVRVDLVEKRYRFNAGLIMQAVRQKLPWADGKALKSEVDLQILDLLGPKTEADLAPVEKDKKRAKNTTSSITSTAEISKNDANQPKTSILSIEEAMRRVNFHKPGENYKTDGYVVTEHTMQLLQQHLKVTGGQVRTRFPPEPNGILHLGHAKAININFGYAAAHGGICFLRYDDTNPEKEEERFFTGILDIVQWLGYKPFKVTHSSDYFDQLYSWAVQLIRLDLAYVCHQTADEMRGFTTITSPWRNRPIAESLQLFEDMRRGKVGEGAAILRMKLTLAEGKVDPVAYRVRFTPHHRTGDRWCIYPTYDYTHCLCDSLEHITHSLCTKEFQSRRSSYYWLCNALSTYCPVQWEFGRLNVHYTVTSKRKIAALIDRQLVNGWDDPRLYTLSGLRRRGCPAVAINRFCAQLGVTGANSTVEPSMLEAFVRDELNATAPRRMVVLQPLAVHLVEMDEEWPRRVMVPDFPGQPDQQSHHHHVRFDRLIYLERSDFAVSAEPGYRRLTLQQPVGLRHAGMALVALKALHDESGQLEGVECRCVRLEQLPSRPKAFVHWVAQPVGVEVRLYQQLFKHKNPDDPVEVPGGYLTDCNPDSLQIVTAFADESLLNDVSVDNEQQKVGKSFQFERIGFFTVDPDSRPKKLVFNQTVSLKEDAGKDA